MLEFGIFDHLDSDGSALGALMESRLRLVELIEAQGFSGYSEIEIFSDDWWARPMDEVLRTCIERHRTVV